ncbi:uncharacterized protein [Notamacropus eugenii]|uniref:uncharacterized protein n=1 Tax=Notamacropus eugenii TaxID=9315 RepID=UPI003B6787CF
MEKISSKQPNSSIPGPKLRERQDYQAESVIGQLASTTPPQGSDNANPIDMHYSGASRSFYKWLRHDWESEADSRRVSKHTRPQGPNHFGPRRACQLRESLQGRELESCRFLQLQLCHGPTRGFLARDLAASPTPSFRLRVWDRIPEPGDVKEGTWRSKNSKKPGLGKAETEKGEESAQHRQVERGVVEGPANLRSVALQMWSPAQTCRRRGTERYRSEQASGTGSPVAAQVPPPTGDRGCKLLATNSSL